MTTHSSVLAWKIPWTGVWAAVHGITKNWTGGSTPLLCLEGVPDLPVAPQDEAGLTKTFQTWPPGWFHIP